jgi:hypothetical protein
MNEISAALIHQFAARCAAPRRIALRERERSGRSIRAGIFFKLSSMPARRLVTVRGENSAGIGSESAHPAEPTGGREAISFASGSDV